MNPSNDKGIITSPSKRHPASMIRSSLVWEYVDRSSIMVENARKGVPVLKVAKALREQPHVRKSTQLNLIDGGSSSARVVSSSPTLLSPSSSSSTQHHHPNDNNNNNNGLYTNEEEEMEEVYESGSVISMPFSEDTQYAHGSSSSSSSSTRPNPSSSKTTTPVAPRNKTTEDNSSSTPHWTASVRERLHIQERQQQQEQASSTFSSPLRALDTPSSKVSLLSTNHATVSPYKQYHPHGPSSSGKPILPSSHPSPSGEAPTSILHLENSITNPNTLQYLKNPALAHRPIIQNGAVVTGGSKTLVSASAIVGSSSLMIHGRLGSSMSSVSSVSLSSTFVQTHIPIRRVPLHTFFQENKPHSTDSVTRNLQVHSNPSTATDTLHSALSTINVAHSIKKHHHSFLQKPKLQLQFNPTANAPVYYGSTIALETLDGWYLTMHPKTGIVSIREPETGWYERGLMPFNRVYLGNGKAREIPYYLFRLVNLQQPLANGPIRAGDPVWLVAIEGRGDEGWQTGSILVPQLHRVIELDSTVVNLLGQPVHHHETVPSAPTAALHDTIETSHPVPFSKNSKPKGADNIMFGLPTGVSIDNKSILDRSLKYPPTSSSTTVSSSSSSSSPALSTISPEYTALSSTLQRVLGGGQVHLEPVERKTLSKFITKDAIRTDTSTSSASVSNDKNTDHTISPQTNDHSTNGSVDDDAIIPKRKEKSLEEFVQSIRNQAAERGFIRPLDRVGQRLGFLRPLVAHVPIFGSKEDYLYGPTTEMNATGLYYRRDPGYEVLYEMANTRTIVVGKWKLQIAHKEVTEDGVLIGGLGIEPTSARALLKGIGQSADYAPKLRKSKPSKKETLTMPKKKGKDNFIDIHENTDDNKSGGGLLSMDSLLDADEDDDVKKKRLNNIRPSEQTGPRNILVNMGLICLEQDWFYVNHALGTPAVRGTGTKAESSTNGLPVSTESVSTTTDEEGGDEEEPTESVKENDPKLSSRDTPSNTNKLPEDSIAFGRNCDEDGMSGGNRREVFLYPHASGVNGPFKVERRGVFRIRMLQTGDKIGPVVNNQNNDAVALRARAQLRRTEQQRLGQAVGKPIQMDEEGNVREPRADKQDPTAAVNLSRHTRQFRYMANQRVNETYLTHEALKFASPEEYYTARMQSINETLQQEASELAAHTKAVFHSATLARHNPSYELNPSASIISSDAFMDGDDPFLALSTNDTIGRNNNNSNSSSSSTVGLIKDVHGIDRSTDRSVRFQSNNNHNSPSPVLSPNPSTIEYPERSKVEVAHHAHEHHYHNGICNLCLGPGGESVYNVDLCQPNQEIADQLLTEDNRNKGTSYSSYSSSNTKETEPKFSSVFAYQPAEQFTKVIEDTDHYLEVRELMDEATDILKQSSAMTDAIMQELATSKVFVPKNTDTATAMGLGRGPESGKFSTPEVAMVAALVNQNPHSNNYHGSINKPNGIGTNETGTA